MKFYEIILNLFNRKLKTDEPWYSLCYEVPENGLILDAGCGDGKYASSLTTTKRNIVCLDIESPKNNVIQNLDFVIGSIEFLPFKNSRFDFVYCLSVIQLIPNDQRACNEFTRILKTGGRLFFTVPTRFSVFHIVRELEILFKVYQFPEFNVPHHHYYSKEHVRCLLSKQYADIKIKGYNFNFFPRCVALILSITVKKFSKKNKKQTEDGNQSQNQVPNKIEIFRNNSMIPTNDFLRKTFSDFAYHYIITAKRKDLK